MTMKKSTLNLLIDAIMLVLMGILAGIGILIKYILLSGEARWEKYGFNPDLQFLGLDRHEWGTIHLIVAIVLIGLLLLHIILHWKCITGIYCRIIPSRPLRISFGLLFLLIVLAFTSFPLLIKIDVSQYENIEHNRHKNDILETTKAIDHSNQIKPATTIRVQSNIKEETEHEHQHDSSIEIKGFMTLQDIQDSYNIPIEILIKELKMPANTSANAKLGHLKKEYNFTMSDIETIIIQYNHKTNNE